jgi:hypothetical protein
MAEGPAFLEQEPEGIARAVEALVDKRKDLPAALTGFIVQHLTSLPDGADLDKELRTPADRNFDRDLVAWATSQDRAHPVDGLGPKISADLEEVLLRLVRPPHAAGEYAGTPLTLELQKLADGELGALRDTLTTSRAICGQSPAPAGATTRLRRGLNSGLRS